MPRNLSEEGSRGNRREDSDKYDESASNLFEDSLDITLDIKLLSE